MYLKYINIKDFRGIERLEIPFEKGINLLIGNNGAGKTTILEAVAVGLGGMFAKVPKVSANGFVREDYRAEKYQITDASTQLLYHFPAIEMLFDINGKEENCIRKSEERSDSSGAKTNTSGSAIKHLGDATNRNGGNLPLLSYMGVSRVASAKRSDYGKKIRNELNDRRCGYIGCLNTVPDKNSIIDWVMKMSYTSKLRERTVQELEFFQTTVSKLMQEINEMDDAPTVYYSALFGELVYESDGEELPIRFLSAGYQSVLWMAMDFAFRLALLNPTMSAPEEAEGIVLIDEIDMHLHPKWQWNVLNAFGRTFPNVQFIIATHAPIVISSCKDAHLICIDDNHEVSYPASAYAYSIDDVVAYTQGSTGIPENLRKLYDAFDRAFGLREWERVRAIYTSMLEAYGEDNTLVKKCRTKMKLMRR